MFETSLILDPLDALVLDRDDDEFRIGLALPRSGALGMARPAGLAAAVMAAEEVDDEGGVGGRRLRFVPIDAGGSPRGCASEVERLLSVDAIDAVVGFHTSDVHRAIERVTTLRVPYVFTAPHEGGRRRPGVGLTGPGPAQQLAEPIRRLVSEGARRWALIGNDYIWPRAVHRVAARSVREAGGSIRAEAFVPMGAADIESLVDRVGVCGVDAVLLSLVGRDLARFNRAFASAPFASRIVRLSGALEESGLLEIDGDDSGALFAAMDWYADAHDPFVSSFTHRWGVTSPPVGAYARGCYDGIHVLSRLVGEGRCSSSSPGAGLTEDDRSSARRPARLACADGLGLVPTHV